MKLLLYSDSFFPAVGGTERVALDLARGLAASKPNGSGKAFAVTVVTRTEGSATDDAKMHFPIIRRPSTRQLFGLVRKADVVHLAGPAIAPMVLGFLARKPVVIEHHGFQTVCPNGQLFFAPAPGLCPGHYMARHYRKCLQCNASGFGKARSMKLLLSTPFRRWLSKRATTNIMPTAWLGSVLRLPRMRTIYHGLSFSVAAPIPAPSVSTFAFQGRLVSTKGAAILIEAARKLQSEGLGFVIKIIGDGPERWRLEQQGQSLGRKIQFLGHVPIERLEEVLSDVSTVVVPSLAGEVFGLVAAENMLRSKALIVSDLGSLSEVVGDAGIIVPGGNAAALAEAMRRVIEEPQAESLGARGTARAAKIFDMNAMIESHASVYEDAVR